MLLRAWHVVCITTLLAAGMGNAHRSMHFRCACDSSAGTSPTSGPVEARKELRWEVAQQPAHRLVAPGLPDFGELNQNVWRSGQPTRKGYARLLAMHVK